MTKRNWLFQLEVERDNPHDLDPLRDDLDARYAAMGLPTEGETQWAMIFRVNADYWEPREYFKVEGVNWQISFFPEDDLDEPGTERSYPFPVCLIACTPGVSGSANVARDVGRLAVRQLVAIAQMKLPLLWGQVSIWEGPMWVREEDDRPLVGLADVDFEVSGATPDTIRERLTPFIALRGGRAVDSVALAYFWYSRAWQATDVLERFMNFWLATLALMERHRRNRNEIQRVVIEHYVDALMARARSFSTQPRSDLVNAFDRAYTLRNTLFHDGDQRAVTPDDVWSLEKAVTQCIELETRLAA